uniref:NADH-ubiquinone oxidoreductase chain 2 n=1 Tax=Ceratina okinawana TaxID=236018 RepID=A0A7U0M7R7_9HYME|nr:NADH dehydrogenase subunit 2 [Ceratina okinawana]QQX27986.1 NADH dehydrogenase subunit 2 [Ceratina okinawana]
MMNMMFIKNLLMKNMIIIMNSIILLIMIMNNNLMMNWLLMEMSTMMSISLINLKSNKLSSIIYYFISSISSILLMSMLIMYIKSNLLIEHYYNLFNLLIYFSLFLKIGIFPFSYWMIYIYELLSWYEIFFMSTFMKFIPLYMYMSIIQFNMKIFIYLMMNSMLISLYSYKFYSLKKIIACSSINQMSFFIILMNFNKTLSLLYMMLYLILIFMMSSIMNNLNLNKKIDFIFYNNNNNKMNMYIYMMIMLIYSMLPPFFSFIMKWMFFMEMSKLFFNSLLMLLLMSSILMIWNYLNILENSIFYMKTMKKQLNKKFNLINSIMINLIFNMILFMLFNNY